MRARKNNGMVSPPTGSQHLMNTTLSPMRSERPSLKGPNAFLSSRNNNKNYGGRSLGKHGRNGLGLGDSVELSPN